MAFKPRLDKPEKGNKYYNRVANGGYSNCIQGYPVQEGLTTLSNCVGYAAGRFNEIIGKDCFMYWKIAPNAENFWTSEPSLSRGSQPKLGSIIVWEGIGSKAGHVAIVEQINSDGSIITSESGYGAAKPFWTQRRTNGNGNWGAGSDYKFLGFIHQPNSDTGSKISRVLKEGCKGEDVETMQARLHALGYMRKSEVDGDFGRITKGALLCFQLENKLEVDGICGPLTKKALGLE